MASIVTNKKNKTRRIDYFAANGERKTLYLGKVSKSRAETIRSHVEEIVKSQVMRTTAPLEVLNWLAGLGDVFYAKLVNQGLAPARNVAVEEPKAKEPQVELGAFLDSYFAKRGRGKKESTVVVYGHTRRCLLQYFGADKPIVDVTVADAQDWRDWLKAFEFPRVHGRKGGKLSSNTVRRRCGIARQFFKWAVDSRLIVDNPFKELSDVTVKSNKARVHFVPREDADKILDACPDAEWRLIFALSRFGGLRCPSEHLALTWQDVDWLNGRVTVRSPKTAHHEGKESRVIPLFDEIRAELEDCLVLAGEQGIDPEEPIIRRYRCANSNLRTQFSRIIKRAGLKPWPKLFQNLRSTRQTELAETLPIHVVCQWLGNSRAVATEHYLQVTDEHFAAALQPALKCGEQGKNAQHNAQQTAATTGEREWAAKDSHPRKRPETLNSPKNAKLRVGGTRLELVASTV